MALITDCHGRNVGEIGRDTGSIDDIVERKLVDEWAGLEEERERLQVVLSELGTVPEGSTSLVGL